MYGNRDRSVLNEEVPDVGPGSSDGTADGFSRDDLSTVELEHLRAATDRVGQAVETLVPGFVDIESSLTDTPQGFTGVVTVQFPGTPPLGMAVEADRSELETAPVFSEGELDEQVTQLVAQAVAVARESRFDPASAPAN